MMSNVNATGLVTLAPRAGAESDRKTPEGVTSSGRGEGGEGSEATPAHLAPTRGSVIQTASSWAQCARSLGGQAEGAWALAEPAELALDNELELGTDPLRRGGA